MTFISQIQALPYSHKNVLSTSCNKGCTLDKEVFTIVFPKRMDLELIEMKLGSIQVIRGSICTNRPLFLHSLSRLIAEHTLFEFYPLLIFLRTRYISKVTSLALIRQNPGIHLVS